MRPPPRGARSIPAPPTRTRDVPRGSGSAEDVLTFHVRAVFRDGAAVINLSDYSPTTLKFIKTNDLACVYILAVEGGRPCKIGHALNLRYRFDQVRTQHPKEITIEHVAWTPSAATAALVSHRLAARAMNAGWYHLDVADAVAAVRKACRMFPSTRIVEHAALMAQLGGRVVGTPLAQITRPA
jgi:hypothetical protein